MQRAIQPRSEWDEDYQARLEETVGGTPVYASQWVSQTAEQFVGGPAAPGPAMSGPGLQPVPPMQPRPPPGPPPAQMQARGQSEPVLGPEPDPGSVYEQVELGTIWKTCF